jgi:alpha-tubulin suppressor-like RCC1 family protein
VIGGNAACWGDDSSGQLGDCATQSRATPAAVHGVPSGAVMDVAVGLRHGCVVASDGTVRCWGDDLFGEVGVDSSMDPCESAMVDGNVHGAIAVPGVTDATNVALGEGSSCALTARGAVYCWGQNRYGQLGDCTPDARTVAAAVAGLAPAMQIVSGALHVCTLASDGAAWCWGDNEAGQLGDGTTTSRAAPARVQW